MLPLINSFKKVGRLVYLILVLIRYFYYFLLLIEFLISDFIQLNYYYFRLSSLLATIKSLYLKRVLQIIDFINSIKLILHFSIFLYMFLPPFYQPKSTIKNKLFLILKAII